MIFAASSIIAAFRAGADDRKLSRERCPWPWDDDGPLELAYGAGYDPAETLRHRVQQVLDIDAHHHEETTACAA